VLSRRPRPRDREARCRSGCRQARFGIVIPTVVRQRLMPSACEASRSSLGRGASALAGRAPRFNGSMMIAERQRRIEAVWPAAVPRARRVDEDPITIGRQPVTKRSEREPDRPRRALASRTRSGNTAISTPRGSATAVASATISAVPMIAFAIPPPGV